MSPEFTQEDIVRATSDNKNKQKAIRYIYEGEVCTHPRDTSENTPRTPYYSTESIYCRDNDHESTMEGMYVHMCDLQVVMKADQSSEFGVGSPYITPL
jgi:hypothetical protein